MALDRALGRRGRGIPPSFPLLHAIIRYARAFPEALHRPKEDTYQFPKLKARTPECYSTIAELEAKVLIPAAR